MYKKTIILVVTLVFVTLSFLYAQNYGYMKGQKAYTFSGNLLSGETISLNDYIGKKNVYLVFWATWCPSCRSAIPYYQEVHEQLAGEDFILISVNVGVNDSISKVKAYKDKYNIPYPIIFDKSSAISSKFMVQGVPTGILIDKEGKIIYRASGAEKNLAEKIKNLISI